jgi:hypothetical protein
MASQTEEGAGMQPFRKLGELVFGSACPWVSRGLAASMLTPLMKNATGNNVRPVSTKGCDYAVWMKSIHRAAIKLVSGDVCPQQLEIGSSTGLELKNNNSSDLFRGAPRIRQRRGPCEGWPHQFKQYI